MRLSLQQVMEPEVSGAPTSQLNPGILQSTAWKKICCLLAASAPSTLLMPQCHAAVIKAPVASCEESDVRL